MSRCTLTIGSESLPLASLYSRFARLAKPAAKDYPAGKAIVCEVHGLFSRSEWKATGPIAAGQTVVSLGSYAGHNYFRDCLGER